MNIDWTQSDSTLENAISDSVSVCPFPNILCSPCSLVDGVVLGSNIRLISFF